MSNTQFVIFGLEKEFYGIDIQKVREIGPYVKATQIPDTPEFVEGIINFRGDIIPIINMRVLFMIDKSENSKEARIIIVNEGDKQLGIVVDEASEVWHISSEDIESASEITADKSRSLVYGVGKVRDRIVMLIDISELFNVNANLI